MKNIETIKNQQSDYKNTYIVYGLIEKILDRKIRERIGLAEFGFIEVKLPNDFKVVHKGDKQGHHVYIHFKTWKSLFGYVLSGQLAFVEAFVKGDITVSCLPSLINWFLDNEPYFPEKQNHAASGLINRFSHLFLNDNSRNGSKKNISFHYDLGNDFYSLWLDKTMTYSAGDFAQTNDLEQSQKDKYQRISDQLDLSDGDRVLEIGCGWGGFAEHVLTKHHLDYRGITISKEQLDYALNRFNQITVRKNLAVFEDYRDTTGVYDKIVSIEMFEAVGEKHWDKYFQTLKSRLASGGKAVIQVITIDHDRFLKYRNRVDFIQKYIFPGGMLPSKEVFAEYARKSNLKIVDDYAFGNGYAETLIQWKKNFIANWPKIKELGFDEQFYRLWLYYLDYCIAGFERNTIDVMHFTMVHGR
ncbi:SAM-dependent methyltransferase [Pseudemcibacter aquimaris]|uniref:SAM-dependent methyltransferase n=1 Tax=Pseudemcibacter aquimaris TaxID=2857064 RepID=UPI002012ECFD|nr:cyclopropane-fatty-acyl-phospholipid synthase family protein [Pseudemcibacter aquimaris]MCC3861180.1 cyclopropane-fatty-acyl-phospholipid synthase family protein [Pseudemcibacter aquimaris]WDU57955.1 cyclopropane-fatty-acyl-phospholipid synthase family protein [Pseudemcibacter aquimaris]